MAHVLIVDGNALERRTLCRFLRLEGHEPVEAADDLEALSALKAAPLGFAFVDLVGATMDRFELVKRIRRDFAATKVVVMCHPSDISDIGRDTPGVAGAVTKPVTREDIRAAVHGGSEDRTG